MPKRLAMAQFYDGVIAGRIRQVLSLFVSPVSCFCCVSMSQAGWWTGLMTSVLVSTYLASALSCLGFSWCLLTDWWRRKNSNYQIHALRLQIIQYWKQTVQMFKSHWRSLSSVLLLLYELCLFKAILLLLLMFFLLLFYYLNLSPHYFQTERC